MYIDLREYETYRANDFAGDDLAITVPRRVETIHVDETGITLGLHAIVCKKEPVVISALMLGRSFNFTGEWRKMGLRLEFVSKECIRIREYLGNTLPQKQQPMLLEEPAGQSCFTVTEEDGQIVAATGKVRVVIQRDPFDIAVYNSAGKMIYHTYLDDMHNVTNDRRRGFKEGGEDDLSGNRAALSFPGIDCFPCGFVEDTKTKKSCFAQSVPIAYNEHFYGFGERFSSLDKNGCELLNHLANPCGVSNVKAYKCIPFFMSSNGYACYFNTPRDIRFSMGNNYFKTYTAQVEDELLDLFLFCGENQKDNLKQYCNLTGKSALPPKWSFGVWMSRNCYQTQEEVLSVAAQLREKDFPCDVMHIDWAYCKTYDYDFEFDPSRFPDVKQMADELEEQGIYLSLWHLPYVKFSADIFEEGEQEGLFAKEADGKVADQTAKEAVIDFSNPKTVQWYQSKLKKLFELGIRVIKTDFGENAQTAYTYHGYDGRDMHNLYPLLYNKAAYEAAQEVHPGDSLVWGRSAYAGCQRYPIYWGGDSDSDYSGMYHSLRGGLSLGLSGFPFWSHDVGGYFCTPEPNVYIRWMQFGMLSPLVRFHGTSAREPWAFGPEAERLYKKYAALRYSLMEYIYNEARLCCESCSPMLRALTLEFPSDPMCARIDDEYLLGSHILVAPVFSDDDTRMVYLPEGNRWMDLHSGKWYEGGRNYRVETPLDIMPIYLRGGSAIPFVPSMQHVNEKDYDVVRWHICPEHGAASYRVHTDRLDMEISLRTDLQTGEAQLNVKGDAAGSAMEFYIHAAGIQKLMYNGQSLPVVYETPDRAVVKL